MTCHTFLCKGLIHQALSLYAIEVPLDVSIVSIRYCSADVDIRPYMKVMYLMRGIAAKWKRQEEVVCDFHFLLFRIMCNARPFIGLFHQASTFSIRYWGALLLSIGSIRYCNDDVDTGPFIKGICTWCLEQHFSPIVSQQPCNRLWCFGLEHCLYSLLQCSICSLVPWYWVSS